MTLTNPQKTLTVTAVTLLILGVMILWMAGAFHSKIKPGTLSAGSVYQGPTLTVDRIAIPIFETVTGTLQPKQTGDISAQVQARIKAFHVTSGDKVKPGDLLISLDDEAIAARAAQARANINALDARLTAAEAHYRRTQQLFTKDSATRADLDTAKSAYDSLKSERAAAQSQWREASHIQGFGQIRATFPGRVTDRHAEPGEITYPGKKLLTLYDPSSMRIEAQIRESVAVNLSVGQRLDASIDALRLTLPTVIEDIVPAANPAARNVLVKMRINQQPDLLPGMFARIRIPQGERQELAVPQNYVHQVGQLDLVWVLQNGQRVRRFVRLGGKLPDGRVNIVAGLTPGEQLLLPEHALATKTH